MGREIAKKRGRQELELDVQVSISDLSRPIDTALYHKISMPMKMCGSERGFGGIEPVHAAKGVQGEMTISFSI